jgi:RNA polymerase sigma-70 factor (ECF subfamily)
MDTPLDRTTATDEQLVAAARQDDMDAFEELVARYRDKIYGRAFSMMRNEDEALEMSQEAWVKAWQRLAQFNGESSFGTWITRIVINLCLDQLRRRSRQRTDSIDEMNGEWEVLEAKMPVVHADPSGALERVELRRRIDAALSQLSHDHRTTLVLHEFEDMKYREIAQAMGCSIGTVMSRLFNARRNLAALLSKMNIQECR